MKRHLIILRLKSTQSKGALADLSSVMKYICDKYAYKIKGHEIQQLHSNIRKMTLTERASKLQLYNLFNTF